tara:strand:+ start:155 stop:562 length:408 start_codon:yes stop_codon:yes gene_type:complete
MKNEFIEVGTSAGCTRYRSECGSFLIDIKDEEKGLCVEWSERMKGKVEGVIWYRRFLEWVGAKELWSDSGMSGGAIKVWLQLGSRAYRLKHGEKPCISNLIEITIEEAAFRAEQSMFLLGKEIHDRGIVFKYEKS